MTKTDLPKNTSDQTELSQSQTLIKVENEGVSAVGFAHAPKFDSNPPPKVQACAKCHNLKSVYHGN